MNWKVIGSLILFAITIWILERVTVYTVKESEPKLLSPVEVYVPVNE